MAERLNQQSGHDVSQQRLERTYTSGLIAAEKKPFLVDLHRSSGPFLAIDGGDLICDGASQIASLGLGFNAGALFGAAEHLESWLNLTCSPDYCAIRTAYEQLLQRKLGSQRYSARFCASGAEAVETALANFFDQRPQRTARCVLSFEGSFHGRMMVALASTWNPVKRQPFAWPDYESVFAPYPEMDGDEIEAVAEPDDWKSLWYQSDTTSFEQRIDQFESEHDELLQHEVESLRIVRQHLVSGAVFAILIEPMQCEGGDRYSSSRFHQGLAYLSEAFDVPLVYDEIQTGFGLGGEFFWHRMFQLRDPQGDPFFPAAVVCAKKAQTGLVLVRDAAADPAGFRGPEPISAASLIRGYIQASVVDQFQAATDAIEATNHRHLCQLSQRFSKQIRRARGKGVACAFDFESTEWVNKFIGHRFQHGLLYYPAGSKTVRFRFNLGYKTSDVVLFWQQLESALAATFRGAPDTAPPQDVEINLRDPSGYYQFHEDFIGRKLSHLNGTTPAPTHNAVDLVRAHLHQLHPTADLEVIVLDAANYPEYRTRILDLQTHVYEPARQSQAAEFDALFASDCPISILVLQNEEIVAMSFAGPLNLFAHQRGVPQDVYQDDPTVAYMLDLTIAARFRGRLGAVLKQAMTLLAESQGISAIHGRNRDRLAGGMWSINLSLGSFATNYLVDDYPDCEPFRDCIYYRCPTQWAPPPIDLGGGLDMPMGVDQLDSSFVRDELPVLVNKMTLSNFVTDGFLHQLEEVASIFPKPLRHLYTANGLSECVDKIVKVLWRHRKPRTKLLTIIGSDFGCGSFLARSLSGIGDAFFEVDRLAAPQPSQEAEFFETLERHLQNGEYLGMMIEPLMRRTMTKIPPDTLRQIVALCRANATPVVFNETASLFYRYSPEAFCTSGVEQLQPDAAIAHLGGQMALVGSCDELFLNEPLLLISTWEGDAFSLAQFHRALMNVESDVNTYRRTMVEYDQSLRQRLVDPPSLRLELDRGVGSVWGSLSGPLSTMLRHVAPEHWISCPSYTEMRRFLTCCGTRENTKSPSDNSPTADQ